MPTSGPVFTAQAPLLPVFFLGLLATVEEHVQVADAWFQQVMHTPVRSVSLIRNLFHLILATNLLLVIERAATF